MAMLTPDQISTDGLAACVKLGKGRVDRSRKNPESYVFFIAAMHHLFGDEDTGITKNWDFTNGPDKAKVVE
jgi:hypothetical protein